MEKIEENLIGGQEEVAKDPKEKERIQSQLAYRHTMMMMQTDLIHIILNRSLEFFINRASLRRMKLLFHNGAAKPIACMDGRLSEDRIAVAGAGVLWTEQEQDTVIDALKRSGIKINGVYRHHDCGAEKLFVTNVWETHGIDAAAAEVIIQEKAERLAHALNTEVHMDSKMVYSQHHFERALVVVGTEVFDTQPVFHGISTFQLNARFCPSANVLADRVDLAIKIAFGKKDMYKNDFLITPFVICLIGDSTHPDYTVEALRQKLEPTIAQYGDFVRIEGWDVPAELLN